MLNAVPINLTVSIDMWCMSFGKNQQKSYAAQNCKFIVGYC